MSQRLSVQLKWKTVITKSLCIVEWVCVKRKITYIFFCKPASCFQMHMNKRACNCKVLLEVYDCIFLLLWSNGAVCRAPSSEEYNVTLNDLTQNDSTHLSKMLWSLMYSTSNVVIVILKHSKTSCWWLFTDTEVCLVLYNSAWNCHSEI